MEKMIFGKLIKDIAEDYYLGNSNIIISTTYCKNNTKEDDLAIIDRVSRIIINDFNSNLKEDS